MYTQKIAITVRLILPTNLVACKPTFLYHLYITSEVKQYNEVMFLPYRPRTECIISQFCNTNCTHSIFRRIEARVGRFRIRIRIYCDIFINKTANRFLIYSYFITSGIFLIILILWIVKRFGQLVELALYKLCYYYYYFS